MVAEVLRSGAFADEIVLELVNRRFVATWYDVAPPGRNAGDAWAYDEDAVQAVGRLDRNPAGRRRGSGSQDPEGRVTANNYPTCIFLAPDGTRWVEDEVWGIVPPEKLVARLRGVIAKHPDAFPPSAEERAALELAARSPENAMAQCEAARICFELAEFDRCLEHVATALDGRGDAAHDAGAAPGARGASLAFGSDAARPEITAPLRAELLYLRARSLLCLHRDGETALALDQAAEADGGDNRNLGLQLALARACLHRHRKQYDAARAEYAKVLAADPRGRFAGDARYYSGLCEWRLGRKEEAKQLWRAHRKEMPWDRLARRSAASLGLPESEAFTNQELFDESGWW